MRELIKRKELELCLVPYHLTKEFEEMVLECYTDYGYYDTHNLGEFVDSFAIYAESHEQTGNPYSLSDDQSKTSDFYNDIINNRFYELLDDVMEVLNYHNMFFVDKDFRYIKYYNLPIKQVW